MTPEASAIWAATAATLALQLLIGGALYGRMIGELRLIKYRVLRVERALELAGVTKARHGDDDEL